MAMRDEDLILPVLLLDTMTVGEALTLSEAVATDDPVLFLDQSRDFWYLLSAATLRQRLAGMSDVEPLQTALPRYVYEEITPRLLEHLDLDDPRPQMILHPDGTLRGLYLGEECALDGWRGDAEKSAPPESAPPESLPPDSAPPDPAEEEPFVAYPDMQAPEQVRVAEWFTLTIGLSPERVAGVGGGSLTVHGLGVAERFDLEVQIMADGFEASDGWRYTLPVARADLKAHLLEVHLRPTKAAAELGRCSLRAHFSFRGQYCGVGYRNLLVLEEGRPPARPDEWTGRSGGGLVASAADPVDITLVIDPAGGDASSDRFTCAVLSPFATELDLPAESFPVRLQDGRNGVVFAGELASQVQKRLRSPLVTSTLRGMADLIAKHLPAPVWSAVRKVALHARDTLCREATLLIQSREYHIPWELAAFVIDPDKPPFLGAQMIMGRWWHGLEDQVPQPLSAKLQVHAMNVVWSEYENSPGKRRLPHASAEAEFLFQTYQAERIAAQMDELLAVLEGEKPAQVLHFACHGATYPSNPGSPELVLESGPPNLSPVDVRGFRDLFERDHPFVFLNACQVGQAVDLLTANMGFAGAFIESGSAGCVAPLWNIVDESARTFVEEFYTQTITEGKSVGLALRDLRARFGEPGSPKGDPTCLAYVFYGHPGLLLKR